MKFPGFLVRLRDRFGTLPSHLRILWLIVPVLLIVAPILLFVLAYCIDDDLDLTPNPDFTAEGGSRAIELAATLIHRQTHKDGWAPSRLWFHASAWSSNMRNFQIGIQEATARFITEMADSVGRERGSGAADADLNLASGNLKYDPTAWLFPSAVSKYDEAVAALVRYDRREAAGQAKYDKIASNLAQLLDRVAKDLGSQSSTIELLVSSRDDYTPAAYAALPADAKSLLDSNGGYFDHRAQVEYYATKGRLYAYYILLSGIGVDFKEILDQKHCQDHWDNMMNSLRAASRGRKFMVANGGADAEFTPNHVAIQGVHLQRTYMQMREVEDILNR
jgi:hypothetical protein